MLERWTLFVLRFRHAVLGLWLVVLVAGAWASLRLPEHLSNSFAVPGTDSERAQMILAREFGERTDGAFTVVFRVRRPTDRDTRARVRGLLRGAARTVPTSRVGELRGGSGILYADIATTLRLHDAKRHTAALRRALRVPGAPRAYVTGQPAIQHDLDPVFESDRHRGEALALPVALIVLLAVLGLSFAVAIPFLFAACTITGTLLVVLAVAHVVSVVTYAANLVVLIGLGLAIDYSLLMVHRFREELELCGHEEVDAAAVRTIATAGRTVIFSGLTVALGLGLLLLMPVPFIRSMGIGGVLIPLVSVAAAVTLQPALLGIFGRRGTRAMPAGHALRSRLGLSRLPRDAPPDVDRGVWARLARVIMRRPKLYLAAGTTVLLVAAAPAFVVKLTPGSISGIPQSLESVRGFEILRESVGPGAVTPTTIVVDAGGPGRARTAPVRPAIDRLADELFHDPEVFVVASGRRTRYTEPDGRYSRVVVVGRHEYGDEPTQSFVQRLREELVPAARFPTGARVYAGGAPAQGADFLRRSYEAFTWIVLAMIVLTYLVLIRAFRSLLLPLKAVVLNLLTVAATCGLLVVMFQWGIGADTLGLYERGQVEAWIPIFVFATLFGLSMDYEVFLVTRMRESWDHHHDNARAVAHGLERTGRVITAAALIMVAAFSGFAAGRIAPLQEFGVALAVAVLIDATIVRAILVPSFMAVLGRYNWWLPPGAARLARVPPSPLVEEPGPAAESVPRQPVR